MLTSIHPKLPMRDKTVTRDFYINQLGFEQAGGDFPDYLMMRRGDIEIHFFMFKELDPFHNYGQVYIRTNVIEKLYQSMLDNNVAIHPASPLQAKPWGMKEFSLLDPDHNLLTFGQGA